MRQNQNSVMRPLQSGTQNTNKTYSRLTEPSNNQAGISKKVSLRNKGRPNSSIPQAVLKNSAPSQDKNKSSTSQTLKNIAKKDSSLDKSAPSQQDVDQKKKFVLIPKKKDKDPPEFKSKSENEVSPEPL